MMNPNTCRECPFWDEDSDGCEHPNYPPCDTDIVGIEVRVSDNPKPFAYVDYSENGGLYYVIECTRELFNNVIQQHARR